MKASFALAALLALPAHAGQITPDQLADLPLADVVFLGEVHDNPAHHVNQLTAITALSPSALVFEMLTPEQATRVPQDLPDKETLRALLDWDDSGWPDFAMYYPLFAAAPDGAVFGAGLPRAEARAAMEQDSPEVFDGDAGRFGLSEPLPPDQQRTREALQARAHCDALPEDLLPGMVAIQRLRDALLAQAALHAHKTTEGPIVVITGTGHARTDWGAPFLLRQAAPDLQVLSIGQFEVQPEEAPPHDLWLVTAPHPRPDPCAAFR